MPFGLCDICGKPLSLCNSQEHLGGVTILRLDKGELNKPMRKLVVSKHRYYLTKDKLKAVLSDNPERDSLLVGKGGEIDAEVARAYRLETEETVEVSVVTQSAAEQYANMVTVGSGQKTQANWDKMQLQKQIADNLAANQVPEARGVGHLQRAALTEGLVNHELKRREELAAEGFAGDLQTGEEAIQAETGADVTQLGQEATKAPNKRSKRIGDAPPENPPVDNPEEDKKVDLSKPGDKDPDKKDGEDKGKTE